jgi:DNA-binding response OmpR family regulator
MAQKAKEGFDLFCDHSFGLVLADWDMTLANGMDLTQKIRHDPLSPDRRVPVVLLTGDDTAMVRMTQARDAGVTGLLLKPFSRDELIKRMTRAMNDSRDFIDCPAYIGPDRRRKQAPGYAGPFRRTTDRVRR